MSKKQDAFWEVTVLDTEEGHEAKIVGREPSARRACRWAVEEMVERQGGPKKRWFVVAVAMTRVADETPPWLPTAGVLGNGS